MPPVSLALAVMPPEVAREPAADDLAADQRSDMAELLAPRGPLLSPGVTAGFDAAGFQQSRLEEDFAAFPDHPAKTAPPKQDLSYLVYYVYSEIPPEQKPAEIALQALKNIRVGTPIEEIKRASDIFGLDFSFMKAVAKIEFDFDPKQRTGSYIGLFQLSKAEFAKYGSGDILNPATMRSRPPTNSSLKASCSNGRPIRSRPSATST